MLAGLAVIGAGCTLVPSPDPASAAQPAEIASVMCRQNHPGDDTACAGFRLPDPTSAMAYGMCLEYHRLDIKACSELRLVYETELRTYLELPDRAANAPVSTTDQVQMTAPRTRELHKSAEALYRATSTDAQTFEAALLIPDVRRKIAAVLRQDLTDEKLRTLARQARSEALYWYAYMQGLERVPNAY
jgi:hypothetical protein